MSEAETVPAAEKAGWGENGSFRFKRKERLKGRSEIREVFGRGKKFGCHSAAGGGGAKLFMLKNSLIHNRICFTFSRGFGNAAERNRARRLGREAYRHLRARLLGGYDLVLLVYPAPKDAGAGQAPGLASRTAQLEFLLKKAGLLK